MSPWLTVSLAVVFVSFGAVLVRLAQAPPLAIAFYRVAIASLILLPFAAPRARRSWPSLERRGRLLLVNTAPLFAIALSTVFLREKPPAAVLVATPVALLGAALIAYGDWTGSPGSLRGNLLAIAGAITVAAYQVVGRGLREALPLDAYVLGVWATAALTLAVLALATDVPFGGFSRASWLAFVALAIVPTIGGHGLVNKSLRSLSAPTVGLFLLGEPLGASLLAYLLLGERPGPWTLAGGAVVIAALALLVSRGRRAPA